MPLLQTAGAAGDAVVIKPVKAADAV